MRRRLFFSCIFENAFLNFDVVISWFSGEMLGGFLNVRMDSMTSGRGSFTSKVPFMIWSAYGDVPSWPMSSARGPVANGVFHDCLKWRSFWSSRALVTLVMSLSRVQDWTSLVGSSCGLSGTMISIRPCPISLPMCCLHLR
jgi:hypothetical protein